MANIFDPTKPVRTRDGRPARIVCTDKKTGVLSDGPSILALTLDYEGTEETPRTYRPDGTCFSDMREGRNDLVNYDPFEITDEEAELIIDLCVLTGLYGNRNCDNARSIRNREFNKIPEAPFYSKPYRQRAIEFRDLIIKHRNKK
jgi:hypothetical protein